MARVLVTGGAGFIGSHLARTLAARGDQVRVFDNFSTGKETNLAGAKGNIDILRGDLRNSEDVKQAVAGIELIFHEAAFVSVPESIEKPRLCYEVNVNGTIELLEAARAAGVGRVVLASSAAVYGDNTQLPLAEAQPTQILSPYAASKLFNENLAQLYTSSYRLSVVALRYFNVYGPRQLPTSQYAAAIPKFIQCLQSNQAPLVFGDGKQTRDFIHVADVVQANLAACDQAGASGKVFNVCSGVETTVLDVLNGLYPHFPNAPQPEFAPTRIGDVPRSLGDARLAAKELGFKARVDLAAGLKQCVDEWQI